MKDAQNAKKKSEKKNQTVQKKIENIKCRCCQHKRLYYRMQPIILHNQKTHVFHLRPNSHPFAARLISFVLFCCSGCAVVILFVRLTFYVYFLNDTFFCFLSPVFLLPSLFPVIIHIFSVRIFFLGYFFPIVFLHRRHTHTQFVRISMRLCDHL